MKVLRVGRILDVQVELAMSAIGMSVIGGLLAGWQLKVNYPLWSINQIGLVAVLLVVIYWLSDLAHHGGHAWAARRAGAPMRRIRLHWLLAVSLYPPDEGNLPPNVHIRRALGGPPVSFALFLFGLGAWLMVYQTHEILAVLTGGLWIINLLIALAILGPFKWMDGGTILFWAMVKNTGDYDRAEQQIRRTERIAAYSSIMIGFFLFGVGLWPLSLLAWGISFGTLTGLMG